MGGVRGKSRQAVLMAAVELFADKGFANTSVREIGRLAGVDPAIVMRHYGSKESLFIESVFSDADAAPLFDAPISDVAERVVRFIVSTDSRLRSSYLGLVRASDTGEVASALREMHEKQFVAPLMELLHGEQRELRARLAASMVGGLMYSLWTVEDVGLLAADHDAIVATYAPALQLLITPRT